MYGTFDMAAQNLRDNRTAIVFGDIERCLDAR